MTTLLSERIGAKLRRYRDEAGLTQKAVAEQLRISERTIKRIEAGEAPLRFGDLRAMLDLYGITDKEVRWALEEMLKDADKPGWYVPYSGALAEGYAFYAELESRATELQIVSTYVVHGLLQTERYARAIQTRGVKAFDQAETYVRMRMERQDRFYARDPMPKICVIMDESAFVRPFGGREVMAEQLHRIADLAEAGTIELRAIPLNGEEFGCAEPFVLFTEAGGGTICASGGSVTTVFHDDEPGLKLFDETLAVCRSVALESDASTAMARRYAEEYER